MSINPAVQKAIDLCGGNQSELARRCAEAADKLNLKIGKKTRQGHVWKWLNSDEVSAEVAVLIEHAMDGAVQRAEFRADLYADRPSKAA